MTEIVQVGIAEYRVAHTPAIIVTHGLGACVGIAIYDPAARMGALAHPLLPIPPATEYGTVQTAKYTSTVVDLMVAELLENGCALERLVAKLAGGASIFRSLPSGPQHNIGELNVAAARERLARRGISLLAEDIGEHYGRTVELHTSTGEMLIKAAHRPSKTI